MSEHHRLYVYKLTTDNNGAPCVYEGVLSLAICKPGIRTTASPGDILFGFAGSTLHPDNRLVYVARVTDVIDGREYYLDDSFRPRPDCVYSFVDGNYNVRRDARYHKDGDQAHVDLGSAPDYRRAVVLMSDDFCYFGGDGPSDLAQYPEIKRCLCSLGRGHRVNHAPGLARELH